MTKSILIFAFLFLVMTSAILLAEMTPKISDYYGLKTISQPYKQRIETLILDNAYKTMALSKSGFQVFKLVKIEQMDYKKRYTWEDLSGARTTTEFFLGLGEVFLQEGDIYAGSKEILWLRIWRERDEMKFTIK